ncbi:MAG TPA: hypothetical protein VN843_34420 [Anaerolineales bacterium]|nr:hypothetical protein [Anaerolineales bacterium]
MTDPQTPPFNEVPAKVKQFKKTAKKYGVMCGLTAYFTWNIAQKRAVNMTARQCFEYGRQIERLSWDADILASFVERSCLEEEFKAYLETL